MQAQAEWSQVHTVFGTGWAVMESEFDLGLWFELLDLPLWGVATFFAFRIASSFRGGALGRGARWVGFALLVVVGGKLVQGGALLLLGEGLFASEFGQLAWGVLLAAAWCLAGLGIYEFYRAGRSI